MRAWTDYPIAELGDAPGKLAPIRLVEVTAWDRDKYCVIEVAGAIECVKRGYLYRQRGRIGKARRVTKSQLRKLPEPDWDAIAARAHAIAVSDYLAKSSGGIEAPGCYRTMPAHETENP